MKRERRDCVVFPYKIGFHRWLRAERWARRKMRTNPGLRLAMYICPYCEHIHITSHLNESSLGRRNRPVVVALALAAKAGI